MAGGASFLREQQSSKPWVLRTAANASALCLTRTYCSNSLSRVCVHTQLNVSLGGVVHAWATRKKRLSARSSCFPPSPPTALHHHDHHAHTHKQDRVGDILMVVVVLAWGRQVVPTHY